MSEANPRLVAVAEKAEKYRQAKRRMEAEALAKVALELAVMEKDLNSTVLDALELHSVTDVATAYTVPGNTPNRNKIYEIRRASDQALATVGYPFEWAARTIATVNGPRVVYDVHATMKDFGPDHVTGIYTWSWDNGLSPELDLDYEPYPTTKYYKRMLEQWLSLHPYPGED